MPLMSIWITITSFGEVKNHSLPLPDVLIFLPFNAKIAWIAFSKQHGLSVRISNPISGSS